ncbi:MAG: ISNCY family transposase [Candidatus Ancillula sp.]|jgi:transposase|nr:ISNCY family transposase [Candidatus Ancillula sp.]
MKNQLYNREVIIMSCIDNKITNKQASRQLGISERQIRRLKSEFRERGCLTPHGSIGNNNQSRVSKEICAKILELLDLPEHTRINFKFFHEMLAEEYNIFVSYSFLCKFLKSERRKSPRKHKKIESHPRRERRLKEGELLQTDASKHQWFELLGDKNYYNIHGFIDDATGKITGLYMTMNECYTGYMEAFSQTLLEYGIPEEIYADGLRLFFNNDKRSLSIEEMLDGIDANKTQFAGQLEGLGIKLIHARSPQAKGRIERFWNTLQGRLPIEFAKRKIRTIEDANIFLREYKNILNRKFSIPAIITSSTAYAPFEPNFDFNKYFSMKFTRSLDRGYTFSLSNVKFRLNGCHAQTGDHVRIHISERIGMIVQYKGIDYVPVPLTELNRPIPQERNSTTAIFERFVFQNCLRDERLP